MRIYTFTHLDIALYQYLILVKCASFYPMNKAIPFVFCRNLVWVRYIFPKPNFWCTCLICNRYVHPHTHTHIKKEAAY